MKKRTNYGIPRTHGFTVRETKPPEYTIWTNMRDRCRNPNNKKWHNYGGAGIQVCERWNDFSLFMEDMGTRSPGMTLERKDSNGNYEPGNCIWATWTQQQRNRCNNHIVTAGGVSRCISEWSEISGIPYRSILSRLNSGWNPEKAVTEPKCIQKRRNNRMLTVVGITQSVMQWAKCLDLKASLIYARMRRGLTGAKALYGV